MSRLPAYAFASMLGSVACGSAMPSGTPGRAVVAIRYEARLEGLAPAVLDVEQTIVGGADALFAEADAGVVSVEVEAGEGEVGRGRRRAVPPEKLAGAPGLGGDTPHPGARFRIRCEATCRVHYRYDLTRAAEASGDALEVALRAGPEGTPPDVLVPASTWLLRPEPLTVNVPVELSVTTPPGIRFAGGIRRGASGGMALRSQELSVAGFTAFGTFQNVRVQATRGAVDLAILGGDRLADDATLAGWVHDTAAALDTVYERFPIPRAQLFLVPERGSRHVEMGRTLPAGGGSIAVFVGDRAVAADLYDDWILAHEMFHLGVPSFWQEGRWLDEGLAVYYEPILRVRAGLMTEAELWRQFASEMPRGLAKPGDEAQTVTTDHDRIYWGGALFALRADLQIRRRTGGARSLDDGLRAVLAKGGDATRIWSVDYFLRVIDEAVEVPVMTEMLAQASKPVGACAAEAGQEAWLAACAPDGRQALAGLWRELGVEPAPGGEIALLANAPLAALRQRIAQGTGGRPAVATGARPSSSRSRERGAR